jgi:Malic enzyme, N-terminal domain
MKKITTHLPRQSQQQQSQSYAWFSLDASTNQGDDGDDGRTSSNSNSSGTEEEPIPNAGEWKGCRRNFMAPLRIKNERGIEILHNPLYNKGTAFKSGERDRLGFRGLLPSKIFNIHLQKQRFLVALRNEESDIQKNLLLEDLHDRNETLYHRVLVDHMDEMAPLIYTPTVGQACMEFATRYRRPRGMYFTEDDRGHMAAMVPFDAMCIFIYIYLFACSVCIIYVLLLIITSKFYIPFVLSMC